MSDAERGQEGMSEPEARVAREAAQAAADLDQSAADADQASSDADQRASDVDQAVADRDEEGRASDRNGSLAYLASREERSATTRGRDASAARRARSTAARLSAAADRDEVARERDQAAAARDRAADEQDLALRAQTEEAIGRAHRERAAAAADRCAAAADRRRAAQDRRVAGLDELTRVLRRGAGELALSHEIDRSRRSARPLVLALIDVDGLKRVNDADGHAAGDALLRDVPRAITSVLRSYDLTVRWGGDEFVCVLSDAGLAVASERVDQIKRALARLRPGASFSAGLADLQEGDSLESLIARADADLYARRSRRDG